jgi:GNAT superfamily N-acetyltransferase
MAARYKIVPSKNYALIRSLEDRAMPNEGFEGPEDGNIYWLVRNCDTNVPVGYCSIRPTQFDPKHTAFLSRAAVLPSARGKGLQRRMIRVRVAWAKRHGYTRLVTYASTLNPPSIMNLMREGFKPYVPDEVGDPPMEAWAGYDSVYFQLEL